MTLVLAVQPLDAAPGISSPAAVTVTNTGSAPARVSLSVAGIEPAWIRLPEPFGPLGPGSSVTAEIGVEIPAGHPPGQLVAVVTAATDGAEAVHGDLVVTIVDGSVVLAQLDPSEVRGGMTGRSRLLLRNRGRAPMRVDLDVTAPEPDLRVRFRRRTHVLQPGQEVRVEARMSARRPLTGPVRRRPFVVSVRTRGTPVQIEGAFTQRALFAPWLMKSLAVLAVVALWATVAVVGISDLSKHVNRSAEQKAIANSPPVSAPAGPSAANPAATAGGAAAGSATPGAGSGGAGVATTAGGASAPSRVSGTVAAAQPGGVTVTLQPSSFNDGSTPVTTVADAPTSGIVLAAAITGGAPYKLYGADLTETPLPALSPSGQKVDSYSTTTSPDGFWAFASVPAGYYTVSFAKPGYSVASYVIDVTGTGKAVSLPAQLVPGSGSASGLVEGPSGPLGGVQLSITNGTVSLTTGTPTIGAVGTWALHGLSTPGTYLLTASDPGYSNQTTIFSLAAGASVSGIKLAMVPGAGSISGQVVSSSTGQPVGGLTVSASNGSVTRTTTTTTTGAVGTYSLPDLPVPGNYALTVSGAGYVTGTQQVDLGSGPSTANATVNDTVAPSGADVNGVVSGPDGQGLPAAGLILSNQSSVFKTLSTSSGTVGSFDFGQVPPGSYVLEAEDFGYTTESAQVTVGSGQVQTVNLSLPAATNTSLATATIQGSVDSLLTAKPIIGAKISIDGQPASATTDANGAYSLADVGPGVHTVTASCPATASCQSLDLSTNALATSDFESTTVQVDVALGAVTFASQILMPKLDSLAGIVIDGTGAKVPNPTVTLTNTASGISYPDSADPTASGATAAQGGFEFDDVPYGTYTLKVSGPAPPTGSGDCPGVEEYAPLTTSLSLAVDTDYLLTGAPGTPDASPVLTVLPQYRVNTDVVAANGVPTPTTGVTVTVTAKTAGVNFSQSCTEDTAQPVVELPVTDVGDSFAASFSYTPSGTKTTYAAPPSAPFAAVDNNATIDTALLVPPSPGVAITMSFPWRQPTGSVACNVTTTQAAPCPQLLAGDLPTVTLTGHVVGSGGSTTSTVFTASADPASGVWSFAPGALIGLAPGPVTFTVAGGAFQPFSVAANTADANFSTQAFTLAPNLATVAGTLSSPSGGTAIEVLPPDPSLLVSASSAGTDNIVWQETGQPTGEAFPGVYDVTFSHAGYDATVVDDFTVGLCDSTCTTDLGESSTPTVSSDTLTFAAGANPVSLDPDETLTVTPVFTPIAGLAYPTVTVTNATGSVVGSTQLSPGGPTATFAGLSATANNYTVTVSAPSFATSVTTVALPCAADTSTTAWPNCGPATTTPGTVALAPTLTPLGYLTGLVQGAINTSTSALAGATVTATLQSTPASGCVDGSAPTTVSAQSAGNGTFVLTNSSTAVPGLCVGATYDVAVTPPNGYSPPSTTVYPVTVAAGATAVDSGSPIVLVANPISQTFVVSDGVNPLTGVTITGSSVVGRTVSGQTSSVTLASGATVAEVTLTPDPTTYNYTFQLAQYATFSETITYTVGEAAQSTPIVLAIDKNTISGSVTTPGVCANISPCGLEGATVTLSSPSGTQIDQVTSGAKGAYSFPSSPSVVIPNGTYLVNVSLAGWQYSASYQPGVVTSPSLVTTQNVSLVPTPTSLSVNVTSNLAGLSSSGYTVSLVPASPPTGLSLDCGTAILPATGEGATQTSAVALASGSYVATFSQVVPDYYTLTVQGTGLPTQAYDSVVVCPGGEVAEYSPAPNATTAKAATPTVTTGTATFEVMAGQITGTVAVSDNSAIEASALSVDISPAAGSPGTTETLFATCSDPTCTTGTFTSGLLVLGPTYGVSAQVPDVAGYAPSATQTVTPTNAAPTANPRNTLTVAPMPVEVEVTVDDVASQKPVGGLDVTLTPDSSMSGDSSLTTIYGQSLDAAYPLGPYTATTPTTPSVNDPAGVAVFSQVVPDPGQPYSITVSDANATANPPLSVESGGSPVASVPLTVSIGAASDNNVVDAYYTGSITGTVYDAVGNTDDVYLCSTSPCSSKTAGAQSVSVKITGSGASGSGSYTFSGLNPTADGGTYYVGSDVVGAAAATSPVTVTSGATTTGPSFVAEGAVTATVDGQAGAAVTFYLCSTSPCTSSTTSYTVHLTGTSASYTFSALAVAAGGTTYYVGSSITDSPTMTVTVEPGVTETATAFQEGSITGTVYDAVGSTDDVYLCSTSPCSSTVTGAQSVSVKITGGGASGSGSYTFSELNPTADGGTYYVGSDVAGAAATTSVTVTSGTTAAGPTFVAEGAVTATVDGQAGTSVTFYLCSSSTLSCTSSTTSDTVDIPSGGSASYTFSDLGVAAGGTTYYVGSSITDSPTMTVTVEPGVTETATAFQEGSTTGTVDDAAGSTDDVYLCSTSSCSSADALQTQTVTIASGATSGSYSFAGLAPGDYYVGSSLAGSVPAKVAVTSGATTTGPTFVAEGGITGTVDDAAGQTADVYLCSTSSCSSAGALQTDPVTIATGATSGSYSFSGLAPGTYYVGSNLAGSSTASVPVSAGGTATGPTFVAEGAITGTVTGKGGDKVTVYLCASASCSASSDAESSDTVTIPGAATSTGSTTYTFSGLAGNGSYYVGSSITTSTSTEVTTQPGVPVTGPTFTGG